MQGQSRLDSTKVLEVLESGGVGSPLFNSKGRSITRGEEDFSAVINVLRK